MSSLRMLPISFCLKLMPIIVCAWSPITTETSVRVTDVEGQPISDAEVKVVYRQQVVTNYDTGEGLTSGNGEFSYEGKAFDRVSVYIQKDGYYASMYRTSVYKANPGVGKEFFNPKIEAVLKPIVNPIPMYARSNFLKNIPAYDKPVGYDLMENDWVSPYGEGRTSDLIFELEGTYQEWANHDSTLTLTFSNEGDGIIAFEASEKNGSRLLSPHEAPEEGYTGIKEWRRSITPLVGKPVRSYERVEDYDQNLNYIIRVRTVLDEHGNIKSALYGKIYGDVQFDPPWDRDSYLKFRAYYLNPTPNDKNIEYEVGKSLIEGINERDEPSLP